jgi:hypothetical protein
MWNVVLFIGYKITMNLLFLKFSVEYEESKVSC